MGTGFSVEQLECSDQRTALERDQSESHWRAFEPLPYRPSLEGCVTVASELLCLYLCVLWLGKSHYHATKSTQMMSPNTCHLLVPPRKLCCLEILFFITMWHEKARPIYFLRTLRCPSNVFSPKDLLCSLKRLPWKLSLLPSWWFVYGIILRDNEWLLWDGKSVIQLSQTCSC